MLTVSAKIAATDTAAAIVYTMADTAPDMIEGWRGATLTEMGGNDTAVVYSDIGNDGTKSLLDRYTSNLPTPTSARSWDIGVVDGEEATADNVPWKWVKRPDDETSFAGPDGSAMLTFMGSVHDIDGMFSCAVAAIEDCGAPARYSDDSVETGEIEDNAADGDWTFVPNEGAELYTDDEDYLTFGWWLDKGEDGKPDYVRLITSASTGLGVARTGDSTLGTALRGAATYTGAAAGKYAMASAAENMYEGGHFTARATLEVDFDDDLPAGVGKDGVALSGMIDNFMTGDTPRDDWSVDADGRWRS